MLEDCFSFVKAVTDLHPNLNFCSIAEGLESAFAAASPRLRRTPVIESHWRQSQDTRLAAGFAVGWLPTFSSCTVHASWASNCLHRHSSTTLC